MFIIRNGTERVPFRNAKFEERERKFEEPEGTGTQNEIGFPGTRSGLSLNQITVVLRHIGKS